MVTEAGYCIGQTDRTFGHYVPIPPAYHLQAIVPPWAVVWGETSPRHSRKHNRLQAVQADPQCSQSRPCAVLYLVVSSRCCCVLLTYSDSCLLCALAWWETGEVDSCGSETDVSLTSEKIFRVPQGAEVDHSFVSKSIRIFEDFSVAGHSRNL